jgi:hypothetical protein
MMLRLVFLFLIVALAIAPQQAPTKAAEEYGFAPLINEPDLTGWDGSRHAWKLDDGVLTERSDGSSPAILVVSGREFSTRVGKKLNAARLTVVNSAPS